MITVGLAGLLSFLLLHLFFLATWSEQFAVRPWPGYETVTASGIVEPWFVNSPRSLWLTRVVFLALAVAVSALRRSVRLASMLALWAGAAVGVIFAYGTTAMRSAPWGWLGFIVYPFRLSIPILIGTALPILVERFRRHA